MNSTRHFLILIGLIFLIQGYGYGYTDVHITLTAKLIRPSCIVTTENGEKELLVNFREVDLDKINEKKQKFSLLITQCDLKKSLQLYLSPRERSSIIINDESVLATSIKGLGIRLSEENKSKALNLYQWEGISPSVSGDIGKITLQSQLVTNQPVESLVQGPFSASISIMVDYL